MVCLDLHFVNNTRFDFEIVNHNDSSKSDSGEDEVESGEETILQLRPHKGAFGIEKGIQGSLMLSNQFVDIHILYDFPAAGGNSYSANPSDFDLVKVHVVDNGKYGRDNPHHVYYTLTERGINKPMGHDEDDKANFAKDAARAGINKFVG